MPEKKTPEFTIDKSLPVTLWRAKDIEHDATYYKLTHPDNPGWRNLRDHRITLEKIEDIHLSWNEMETPADFERIMVRMMRYLEDGTYYVTGRGKKVESRMKPVKKGRKKKSRKWVGKPRKSIARLTKSGGDIRLDPNPKKIGKYQIYRDWN